jgi:hypothetical protein
MSLQSDAAKTATDDWRVRAALKPKERYTVEDFPIGRLVVCERSGAKGRTARALIKIADSYALRPSAQRYEDYGLSLFGTVMGVDDEWAAAFNGHLVRLSLAPRGQWWGGHGEWRVTTASPKHFAQVGRHPEGGDANAAPGASAASE